MKKEEIQNLLTQFGFSVTLNRGFDKVNRTHMMHTLAGGTRLVDYYIDENLGSIRKIFLYSENNLECVEDVVSLETWLRAEL